MDNFRAEHEDGTTELSVTGDVVFMGLGMNSEPSFLEALQFLLEIVVSRVA